MLGSDFAHDDAWVARYYILCRRAARKFARAGIERSDLEQVAAIGLIKAARRYDPSANIPFEAYAWILISGELMHYIRDHEHLVRIPRSIRTLERAYWETYERLTTQLEREPRDDEIAIALGKSKAQASAAKLARSSVTPASIEAPGFREQAIGATPERAFDAVVTERIVLEQALALLAPAERFIVVSHYVFGRSQDEIATKLGLTKRRVSRMQYRALERMRAHLAIAT